MAECISTRALFASREIRVCYSIDCFYNPHGHSSMKILHKYLSREILVTLFFASIVFTFVLLAGKVLPEFLKLLSKRVPPLTLLHHFLLLIPYLLTFSIPMSM